MPNNQPFEMYDITLDPKKRKEYDELVAWQKKVNSPFFIALLCVCGGLYIVLDKVSGGYFSRKFADKYWTKEKQ